MARATPVWDIFFSEHKKKFHAKLEIFLKKI
jgi:hypothetical protein